MTDFTKIDRQKIEDLINEIEKRLKFLKELAKTEKARFLTDHLIFSTAERDLQVAIEACMDIARHLIVKIPLDKPKKENREIFKILAEYEVLNQGLGEKLYGMAGMRNILVHQYMEVHRERIYQAVSHELQDIEEFVFEIQKFLDKLEKDLLK